MSSSSVSPPYQNIDYDVMPIFDNGPAAPAYYPDHAEAQPVFDVTKRTREEEEAQPSAKRVAALERR
jgi:hypothetical protein